MAFLASAAASAQTLSISGRVTDPQGAAVVNAVVTLNPSSTAARVTTTGADPHLAPRQERRAFTSMAPPASRTSRQG